MFFTDKMSKTNFLHSLVVSKFLLKLFSKFLSLHLAAYQGRIQTDATDANASVRIF